MKSHKSLSVLLAIAMLLLPMRNSIAEDIDDYEAARVARMHIETRLRMIDNQARGVHDALTPAMQGELGQLELWRKLSAKVKDYEQELKSSLEEIDRQVRVLLTADPGATLPQISVSSPFDGPLLQAMPRYQKVKADAEQAGRAVDQLGKAISALKEAQRADTQVSSDETLSKAIPEWYEIGITGLCALYFPPAALVVGLGFLGKQVLEVSAATIAHLLRTKGRMETLKYLREKRRECQDVWQKLNTLEMELGTIVNELDLHKQKYDELRQRVDGHWKLWRQFAGDAQQMKAEKRLNALDESLDKVKAGSTSVSGCGKRLEIQPSEYEQEAQSIIATLRSGLLAVRDGADPVQFQIQVYDAGKRLHEHIDGARKERDALQDTYRAVLEVVRAQLNALGKEYQARWRDLPSPWKDRARYEAEQKALGRWFQANQTAISAPARQACEVLLDAEKELKRRQMLMITVRSGAEILYSVLSQWAGDARRIFMNCRTDWYYVRLCTLESSSWQAYEILRTLDPAPWTREIAGLPSFVDNVLAGNAPPGPAKEHLLRRAESLRVLGRQKKQLLPASEQAIMTYAASRKEAAAELLGMLDNSGYLIARSHDGSAHRFTFPYNAREDAFESPSEAERDAALEIERDWIRKYLGDDTPQILHLRSLLDKVSKSVPEQLAGKFDAAARELDDMIASVEFYRGRREVAWFRISRISEEHSGKTLLEWHRQLAAQLMTEAFAAPAWRELRTRANALLTAEQSQNPAWESLTVRESLERLLRQTYASTSQLFQVFKSVRTSHGGGFVKVDAEKLEDEKKRWEALQEVLLAFDRQAGPLRENLVPAVEKVPEYAQPVVAAYDKMPAPWRRVIAQEHASFTDRVKWLHGFLGNFSAQLVPFAGDSPDARLTNIANVFADYQKASEEEEIRRQRQREVWEREEAERKRRQSELEEEQRLEAERLKEELLRQQEEETKNRAMAAEVRRQIEAALTEIRQSCEVRNAPRVMRWFHDDCNYRDTIETELEESFREAVGGMTLRLRLQQILQQGEEFIVRVAWEKALAGGGSGQSRGNVTLCWRSEEGQVRIVRCSGRGFWEPIKAGQGDAGDEDYESAIVKRHPPGGYFDFSSGRETGPAGDVLFFRFNNGIEASQSARGIRDMGRVRLDSLDKCPDSGLSRHLDQAEGHSYWIKTGDGAVKFRIEAIRAEEVELEYLFVK